MNSENRTDALLALRLDAAGPTRLPRLLQDAGCRVTLFSPPHIAAVRSRFVNRRLPAPVDPTLFTERLHRHLAEHGDDYQWIQAGDEAVLRSIAERYQEEWTSRCLPVPRTPLHITLITNKHAFLALAARAGMAVPAWDMSIGPEELGDIARHIGFPLMLKRAEGMAGAGVRYVASAEELSDANWSITPEQPLMVQQCIGGSLGSTEVLFCRGHPVAWINSYHREFWPTPLSASCVRELADVPEAEDLLNRIGALTGYHGFAGVDWLRDRNDGRLYLIELNPRPTPCYHLGPRVGVDFSAALRGLLAGHPGIQRPRPSKTCRALVHQFPQYCYRAIDDRMFHQLWKVAGDIPREDPRLVVALLRRVCTHFLPTSLRDTLRNLLRPDGPIQAGSGDGSRDGARR